MGQSPLPRHVAIIMDGNGRWAQSRGKLRPAGHIEGVKAVRRIVKASRDLGIEVLTLFAFSQENWKRPPLEVRLLMELLMSTLERELPDLHKNGVRLRVIGEHDGLSDALRARIDEAQRLTDANTTLTLVVAVGYGGQWDIAQAAQKLAARGEALNAEAIERELVTHEWPHPDLLIRTGGEYRISNFMLWQLAYTELYFTDLLWPDADIQLLRDALAWYAGRERRYGNVPAPAPDAG
ncbi:di-trans,poly-cis-decaprenylcistransferase [Solimonas sp. C16B3]|uniref:Ditrans,polycis-undecaprenyl-diphosphate synthase ((2E,6E)-farnesyl-diphosphate specific) n=2 Tax=Solimonas marina TaxID=2714601 RepID=A0A969WB05_9GAMM|nr:di-trans,poly-cis-decaprenylcistransferase [Solimonas marina]